MPTRKIVLCCWIALWSALGSEGWYARLFICMFHSLSVMRSRPSGG